MMKPEESSAESRAFRLDKNILKHVIKSQAGTPDKALLELVMNSVDAGASRVDIELSENTFRVTDNGKGFASREEVENFFETFGTPHEEGDAVYGKFRMGRGQIMAFTKNRWTSGKFRMDVDIENRGLNYELTELDKAYKGCMIEGTFYESLRPSELVHICQDLEIMVKYVAIPVTLNGARISVDMKTQKWSLEDEDAYYLFNETSYVQVYNLGVFVRKYYESSMGQGGIVVSKKQLEVNFARNDVLVSKCAVWKRIYAVVRKNAREKEEQKPRKTEIYRTAQARDLISADVESAYEFARILDEEELFTDFRGRHWSLPKLYGAVIGQYNGVVVLAPSSSDRISDKLHSSKQAMVLAQRTLDRFNVRDFPELMSKLKATTKSTLEAPYFASKFQQYVHQFDTLKKCFQEIKVAGKHIKSNYDVVDPKKLSAEERRVLKVLNKTQWSLLRAFTGDAETIEERILLAGSSDTALMWTDGAKSIFINRNLLEVKGFHGSAYAHATKLAALLVHEYLHSEDDTDSHVHNAEFFERHHNIMVYQGARIGGFIHDFVQAYVKERLSDKASMRKGDLVVLDQSAEMEKLAA